MSSRSSVLKSANSCVRSRKSNATQVTSRKILVVDDNPAIRTIIADAVAQPRDVIYECFDGAIAVSSFERLRPDLVLMDIELDGMDGLSATREICQKYPEASIIIVSQYHSSAFRLAARKAGASEFICKDDLEKLPQIIQELC